MENNFIIQRLYSISKLRKIIFIIYISFLLILFYYKLYRDSFKEEILLGKNTFVKKTKKLQEKLELTTSLLKIYSEIYDYIRNGYTKPRFSDIKKDYSLEPKNYNICICSIAKNENLYAREFVEYYLNLGVDKIFIYDNNDLEGENFDNILNDFIRNKSVEIIDVRGLSSIIIPIYNHCYRKYKDFYDWFGFLDFDEYLFIENKQTLKDYIYSEKFNKCQLIFFNWIIYNDNGLIKYENKSLLKRFTNPVLNYTQGKSFVRGRIKNFALPTVHIPGINIYHFCNSNGDLIYPNNFFVNKFESKPIAYIKHFYTKTIEEFCNKINKHPHYFKNHPEYVSATNSRISFFFQINKKTKEKLNIR